MKKIGLLSDTHHDIDDRVVKFLKSCDEIWHAGDIGSIETADKLASIAPLKLVFGNADGADIRVEYPEDLRFMCEGVDVFMTHIGGYPGKYDRRVAEHLRKYPPRLFISGHSHILKVMNDKKLGLLHINPGAAGIHGFHKVRTAVRFVIDGVRIKDLELLEFPREKPKPVL